MKFITFVTAAALVLNAIAAPSPNPEAAPTPAELVEKDTLEARATCDYAYNGNTPSGRGPGQTYNCRKVSWDTVLNIRNRFSPLTSAMSDLARLTVALERLQALR
ncbi:hypothetical protein AAF712_009567 [Marasmius tenuissimus]|uniref:Uncharacterized protein n=1 Tax=Marasmius tenuissimus TaxID=585030 RepID=A0ABR2ZS46_9AGAR